MSPIMECERALADASSYLLFEASGDSESDYYETAAAAELGAEDDAESCSFSGTAAADGGGEDDHFVDTDSESYAEEYGGEAEEGVVDQCRGGAAAAELNKSKGCESSSDEMKLMSEREMDRLFWEACLAS